MTVTLARMVMKEAERFKGAWSYRVPPPAAVTNVKFLHESPESFFFTFVYAILLPILSHMMSF